MWYDPRITLSYNAFLNMVIGARSCGKTFNTINYCKDKFIKARSIGQRYEMAYVRRYNTDLKACKPTFFDALIHKGKLDGHEVSVKGNIGYIDKEPFVHFFCVTKQANQKSVSYPYIKLIVFDEFLVDRKMQRYAPEEVTAFLELYQTIARERDIPILMLANAISITNPYFAYFNIRPNGKKFQRIEPDILLHTWQDDEQKDTMLQTKFGKLVSGTAYGDYAIDNKFFLDNNSFVCDRPNGSSPFYKFRWVDKTYTVWKNFNQGLVWIGEGNNKNVEIEYALSREDQLPNQLLAKGFRRCQHFQISQSAMEYGCLYYDSIDTKNIWGDVCRMISLL